MAVYTVDGLEVQPGDFAVVHSYGNVSRWIEVSEYIALRLRQWKLKIPKGNEDWEHAIMFVGGQGGAANDIIEAEPGGAKVTPFHYRPQDCLWSTGKKSLNLTDAQRAMARPLALRYWHTPYSYLDYLAIAFHSLHLDAPGLRTYIKSTKHMICSQLVDRLRMDMGSNLFTDPPRWEGFVDPLDLGLLIENAA